MSDDDRAYRHQCQFCGLMRERVCCGPTRDIAICLDCASLAVDVLQEAEDPGPGCPGA